VSWSAYAALRPQSVAGITLPPALLIVAVVACGLLFGLPGIVLTTPLTVLVMVLVQRLYVEDVLGKRVEPVPHSKE
jgi:predicted PurR-regulated permease PerM